MLVIAAKNLIRLRVSASFFCFYYGQRRKSSDSEGEILVFGLAAVDLTSQFRPDPTSKSINQATTYPGNVRVSLGGVGRNVAEASHRLLASSTSRPITQLIAPLGARELDPFSKIIIEGLEIMSMRTDGLFKAQELVPRERTRSSEHHSTPVCSLLLDSDGDLINGVADMEAADALSPAKISETFHRLRIRTGRKCQRLTVAMDGNLSVDSMARLLEEVASCSQTGRRSHSKLMNSEMVSHM